MAIAVVHISTEGWVFSTDHSTFKMSNLHAASIQETPNCSAAVATRYHTTVMQRHCFHAQLAMCRLQVREHGTYTAPEQDVWSVDRKGTCSSGIVFISVHLAIWLMLARVACACLRS